MIGWDNKILSKGVVLGILYLRYYFVFFIWVEEIGVIVGVLYCCLICYVNCFDVVVLLFYLII